MTIDIIVLENNNPKFISPLPKKPYLKHSKIPVNGFNFIKNIYFDGIIESGYNTGVANINSCMPNVIKNIKSLYLVVKEEINIPNPKDKVTIKAIRNGVKSIQ